MLANYSGVRPFEKALAFLDNFLFADHSPTGTRIKSGKAWKRHGFSPAYTLHHMIRRIATAFFLLLTSAPLLAQPKPTRAQSEVRVALATLVQAFDNLDWETFRLAICDDATVFYPRGFPERANGRAESRRHSRSSSIRFVVVRLGPHIWTFSQRT